MVRVCTDENTTSLTERCARCSVDVFAGVRTVKCHASMDDVIDVRVVECHASIPCRHWHSRCALSPTRT